MSLKASLDSIYVLIGFIYYAGSFSFYFEKDQPRRKFMESCC
ncbi:hypothetical protein GAMM_10104 [Gammaproteobacteria bacterium]